MADLRKIIQNQWQNVGLTAKIYFKSHDLVMCIQPLLLIVPFVFGVISLCSKDWNKFLDASGLVLSFFALVYFITFGKNQELFKEWWEKYLVLYHEIETYYKKTSSGDFTKEEVDMFTTKINSLNEQKRPEVHWFAKKWADSVIDKEMTYSNEKQPWYI